MKRVLCLVLCLLMLNSALAESVLIGDVMEVVKCNEYITLRAEPSTKAEALDRVPLGAEVRILGEYDEKFMRVMYGGQAGFVLSEYLEKEPTEAVAVDVAEGSEEYRNVNRFLTGFTEQFFLSPCGYWEAETATDAELVQFAIEHIRYSHPEDIERGEWGAAGNVRLSAEHIAPVCAEYFGRAPQRPDALSAEYADGYYYWHETGEHMPGGFAHGVYFERVGTDQYRATFTVHGVYGVWDDSVFSLTTEELYTQHPEYTGSYRPVGSAAFTAADLLDVDTWKIDWLCINWLQGLYP